MRNTRALGFALALLMGAAFAGSTAQAQDPPDLCAGKGTIDETKPLPASLAKEAGRLFGSDDLAFIRTSTVYRCMNDRIWLCNYGANLVCDKADTSRSNPGVTQWCKANPGSSEIPMAATGHGTIYSWRCVGTRPRIAGTLQKVDARGYIADNWKLLR